MKLNELLETFNTGENRWLIENLIPMGEIVILYAQTNQYKTFLSLKIALEVATGSQELGATESGCVYMISSDTKEEDFLLRINGIHQAKYMNHDIGSSLDIDFDSDLDLTNEHFESNIDEYPETGEQDHWSWEEQGKWNAEEGIKLIVIDTLSQSIGGNSINDDSAIRRSIRNLKKWIRGGEGKFSILVIAHASKKSPSKGIMGSSLQHNDFPTVLKVKKTKSGLSLYREKIKCDAEGSSIPFTMKSVFVNNSKTLYVDIGKEFLGFQAEILRLYTNGFDKEEIKSETHKIYGGNYATHKSFNVSFNRYWKNLVKQGFIKDGKQGNI